MSSFDSRLFVDINKKLKKHLICSICLNIFDNAVTTDCGHNFCQKCIKQLIENNGKECPECRQQFKKKRTIENVDQNNLVMISGYVFIRNLMANSMVNESIVKCKYEFNGCQQTMELSSLKTHLKECDHRICKTCDLTIDEVEGHNCLERLKSERNRLELELNEIKVDFNEHKQNAKQMLTSNQFKVEYIMFGTHLADPQTIGFKRGSYLWITSTIYLYREIDLIMYCLEPTLPFVVIQLEPFYYHFNESLKLKDRSMGWFDIESEDPSERYIIIKLMPQMVNNFIKLMTFWSSVNNYCIRFESIDGNKTKKFVKSARKLITQ